MTEPQEPRNETSQLADERALQGVAHATNVQPTPFADRRDSRRRSVGYGWSAAGTTLVI
jgi:hypothetical protein